MGLLPWEILIAFPGECQLRQNRATQPTLHSEVFKCFQTPPTSDMDYRINNVHTDVNASDCTRGCTDTVRESALKIDSGKKIPCRTGGSNLRQRRACPTRQEPPSKNNQKKRFTLRVHVALSLYSREASTV